MSSDPIRCDNCGAIMSPQGDGRTYACGYCRAESLVAVDSDQIAAGLRLDRSNADVFLAQLAEALAASIGQHTRISSDGGRVVMLEVTFDKDAYVASRGPHGIVAQHKRMVRGVALKTVTHPLDQWVDKLTESIARHANESAQTTRVIAMLGGQVSRRR